MVPPSYAIMQTADDCRQRAVEAEELSRVVALGADRERLQEEARSWRRRAEEIDAREREWRPPEPPSALSSLASMFGWKR